MASVEDPALRELLAGFKRLLQSGELSDLTICSINRKYAVHKAVICPQSAFFWTACTQSFKERAFQEIDLRNDDPSAVHCMIQYFYTLVYPKGADIDDPAHTTVVREEAIRSLFSGDHIHTAKEAAVNNVVEENASHSSEVEDGAEDHLPESPKTLSETNCDRQMSSAEESREVALGRLHQDLLVYAMAEKYGIPDLKKKAAHHFDKEFQQIEITTDVFDIIREVYSITPSQDRGLRDIVVAKVYGEVQHWVKEAQFMETLSCEGDFCADLLAYTVKEDLKQYEAALANIEHPGYCDKCQATFILKRWVSRKRNVHVKKYCARCEP